MATETLLPRHTECQFQFSIIIHRRESILNGGLAMKNEFATREVLVYAVNEHTRTRYIDTRIASR